MAAEFVGIARSRVLALTDRIEAVGGLLRTACGLVDDPATFKQPSADLDRQDARKGELEQAQDPEDR